MNKDYQLTCDVTCACVCSNSSILIGLVVGTWYRHFPATSLHSMATLPLALILSSLVRRERKANLLYFFPKLYAGTSWHIPGSDNGRVCIHFNHFIPTYLGPLFKITTLLVNVLLKFQTLISKIRQYFLLKM